ncbi:unnamed protein product [Effrenium voratum]|nr:unnamed protein product [Effrenium voratum]
MAAKAEMPPDALKESEAQKTHLLSELEEVKAQARQLLASTPSAGKPLLQDLLKRISRAHVRCTSAVRSIEKAVEAACAAMSGQPEKASQAAEALGALKLAELTSKYMAVQKPIALTTAQDIAQTKTVRKLAPPEVLEILESSKEGMERVRARCVRDGLEGWVTVKGNQGTTFLAKASKPFLVACEETVMEGTTIPAGEVLELLEGPKSTQAITKKAQGKALSDDAAGWFTVVDKFGEVHAEEVTGLYKCCSPAALTRELSLQSEAVGRVAKGSCLKLEEGPLEDSSTKMMRLKCKVFGSDLTGWVTVKGNVGTVFVQPCERTYVVRKATTLGKRELKEGEFLQVSELKEESTPSQHLAKVRSQSGSEGWVEMHKSAVKPWTRQYKALIPQVLRREKDSEDMVRQVSKGETFVAIDMPSAGFIKVKGKKDTTVGWLRLQSEGRRMLEF